MKYRQLVAGFALGILFSYGAYRVAHHIRRVGGLSAFVLTIGQPAHADPNNGGNVAQFSKFNLLPTANLSQVTFAYDLTPVNFSGDVAMQLFLPVAGDWQEFTPTDSNGTLVIHLSQGSDCTGQFVIDLPKGTYNSYRVLLFKCPDGKNPDYGQAIYDSGKDQQLTLPKLGLQVVSDETPVGPPTVSCTGSPTEVSEGNGLSTVTLPAVVKYATSYSVSGGGFWVMAKGSGGFAQTYVSTGNAVSNGDTLNPTLVISAPLVIKDVKPGLWNVQMGLFTPTWGQIQWVWPGPYFEAGGNSWESLAPEGKIPPRLQVEDRKFELLTGTPYNFYKANPAGQDAVTFVRGGNYGNAIVFKEQPALDTPSYFSSLAAVGCHYIRFNFDPDHYLSERAYQDSVDQVVQNIWSAGLYPIIAPQDLPTGDSLIERVDKGDRLMKMLAARYSGRSIWLEICNEPHEFNNWADWKPVAVRYVKTIRDIDPNAFVIVPFEGYSKDGRGAALSPITETHVDLYDGHAYVDPGAVAADFGPAIRAGLPVIIGEYGANSGPYLHSMDLTFQQLPLPPMAVSPWAFTIKGDDTIPLIADASTSNLVFTPAGQSIADDFNQWDSGHKIE